jgi:NADH:ubiquinone oxidoreductase subunit D
MISNPQQDAEEQQTIRENELRQDLRIIEDDIANLKEKRDKILIELGRCMVERLDDEN